MKKSRKAISLLLSVLIVLSSVTVGFYAMAAGADDSGSKSEAVTAVEEAIQSFYDNHRNYIYSAKEEEAEQKEAARKAFDDVSAKVKALSEKEKLEVSVSHYAYWAAFVQNDVARNLSGNPSKSPSTQQSIDALNKNLKDIEAVIGELPGSYKDAIEAFQPYFTEVASGKYLASYGLDYTDNQTAQDTLALLIKNVKSLDEDGLEFSDYLYPYGSTSGVGFYIYALNPSTSKFGTTVSNIFGYVFDEQQDLFAGGSDPKSVSYFDYVSRTGSSGNYTYSWKSDRTPEGYIDAFNAYYEAVKTDIIVPTEKTLEIGLDLVSAFDDYKDVEAAVNAVVSAGKELVDKGTVAVDTASAALDKVNALSENARLIFDKIGKVSKVRPAANLTNVYTADKLTAELAYTNPTKVTTYTVSTLYDNLSDVLSQLQLEDFEKYVNGVDLDNLTSSVVETAREKYVAMPEDFRKKVSDDVLAKFMVIIKPESSDYKFDKEIKEYQMTKIVRPADSEVANTVGGIQSAVDGLWSVVTDTVLPLVAPEVDLSNGLDPILEENVYTNEMVSKIFDLYATLSHDETDIGVAGMTLGGVIKLIISPSKIATVLEEEKYSAAAEKIKACKDLDALAEAAFESGDFGFQDGDRQGFVDALLAVLRPITTLLAPGTSILIVDVGVNMFDYVDGNGQYVEGVYSRLIPLLEQIGATSLPTAEEYKANYYKVAETSKNIAADEFLRPVIDALLNDVLDVVSPDPLNGLIKVLPRIAYVIGTDELNDTIAGVFTQMGVLKDLGSSLDLSAESINKMLTASPIDLSGLVGTDCKIKLQAIDWMTLANCATVEVLPSKSNSNQYFILRTGDTDTCFTTVFYYIYDVLFADASNYAAVKGLLSSALGGMSGMVVGILDDLVAQGKVGMYGTVLDALGTPGDEPINPDNPDNPDNPEDPDKPVDPDKPGTSDKPGTGNSDKNPSADALKDKIDNLKNTNKVKSPSIPNTGVETGIAFGSVLLIVSIAASVVIIAFMKKRKASDNQ